MQFIPATAARYGLTDAYQPVPAIRAAGALQISWVPLDIRRKTFVPIVNLADFTNAPTRRDSNGQIDLDHIVAVSLQDMGAQKNMAGPNEITLHGMTWIY